jgi:hypothetical protein
VEPNKWTKFGRVKQFVGKLIRDPRFVLDQAWSLAKLAQKKDALRQSSPVACPVTYIKIDSEQTKLDL